SADRLFGITAAEQLEGESLDDRLKEEQPSRAPLDRQLALEDEGGPDDEDELVATASVERDPFVSPEEAAMTVRDRAPRGVDHPEEPGTEFEGLDPPDPEESEDETQPVRDRGRRSPSRRGPPGP